MPTIYTPITSPDDWRHLLADPEKHWRSGCSAKELAECWQCANGFPAEFQELFAASALGQMELLLAIPEYQVELAGSGHPSQNDLFALGRTSGGQLAAIMVEGKVGESFDEKLADWLKDASPGKQKRLGYLLQVLGLLEIPPLDLRYQLFHRAASAVLTARRFNAAYAIMAAHSFSPANASFEDYQAFLRLFGVTARPGQLVECARLPGVDLYAAWVTGKPHENK